MFDFYNKVKERFLRYVKIDTHSSHESKETPTTKCQFDLANILEQEMKDIGISNVWQDKTNCIVYGTIKGNVKNAKKIGFIVHMDTSPEVNSTNVKPFVKENYQGEDIVLNEKENIVFKTCEFPNVLKYIGQDIVFTDGTTLLGGDDKAAIAELMTFSEYLICNKDVMHGDIKIAFTPDEEVGGLARNLDLDKFGADIAYTIDGDDVGFYSDETFNAIEAQLKITGKSVHPGTAKGKMINAVEVGLEFLNDLPKERPENTEGRVGFFHTHEFKASVEGAQIYTIIRDHDENLFNQKIEIVKSIVEKLNKKYGNIITLEFGNGYLSMKKVVDKVPFMITELVNAIKKAKVNPTHLPFRGGTDGSAISQRGLPCPNISAGYENGHSRFEFVPIQSMVKITEILINLVELLKNY